ncbi:hypothetical protein ABW21_db0204881 [Orbilia brochopaga]|nr:hypothetical protein ABW21_db0204881 [Drechslerella brochopaga]
MHEPQNRGVSNIEQHPRRYGLNPPYGGPTPYNPEYSAPSLYGGPASFGAQHTYQAPTAPGPRIDQYTYTDQAPATSNVRLNVADPGPPAQPQTQVAGNRRGRTSSSAAGATKRPNKRSGYTSEEENFLVFANEKWPGGSERKRKATALEEWLVHLDLAKKLPYRSGQSSWEHYDYVRKPEPGKAHRPPLKDRLETYNTPKYIQQRAEMAEFFRED